MQVSRFVFHCHGKSADYATINSAGLAVVLVLNLIQPASIRPVTFSACCKTYASIPPYCTNSERHYIENCTTSFAAEADIYCQPLNRLSFTLSVGVSSYLMVGPSVIFSYYQRNFCHAAYNFTNVSFFRIQVTPVNSNITDTVGLIDCKSNYFVISIDANMHRMN